MEHREADARTTTGLGSSADEAMRFLRELRQLRDSAGLGHAELAARAHFPYDLIKAAEVGPSLPELPVLSAIVRACGGATEEWEERWRALNNSPSEPLLSARPSGYSDAADAGARLGASSSIDDAPDPSLIRAALDRVAESMAAGNADAAAQQDLPSRSALPARAAKPSPSEPSAQLPSRSGQRPARSGPPTPPPSAEPFSPWTKTPAASAEPAAPEPSGWGNPSKSAWDPIRMSTAWPALREDQNLLPNPAEPAGGRAPWDEPSWDAEQGKGEPAKASPAPSFPDLTPSAPSTSADSWTPPTRIPDSDVWTPRPKAGSPPAAPAAPETVAVPTASAWAPPPPAAAAPAEGGTDTVAAGWPAAPGTTAGEPREGAAPANVPATGGTHAAGGHARQSVHQGKQGSSKKTLVLAAIIALIVIVALLAMFG